MEIWVGIVIGVVSTVVGGAILTLAVWAVRRWVLPKFDQWIQDRTHPVELEIDEGFMKVRLHSKRMIHELSIHKNGMDVLVSQTYFPGDDIPALPYTLEPNDVLAVHWSVVNLSRTRYLGYLGHVRPRGVPGRYRVEPEPAR